MRDIATIVWGALGDGKDPKSVAESLDDARDAWTTGNEALADGDLSRAVLRRMESRTDAGDSPLAVVAELDNELVRLDHASRRGCPAC